jgi:hypothetical protein
MSVHTEAFEAYDRANPETYRLFRRFALELLNAGRRRISHNQIIHRIRWETNITTGVDDYKVNQNFGRPMALRFVAEYPQHANAFEFRHGIEER